MFASSAASAVVSTGSVAASVDPASIALPNTRQVDVTSYVVEAFARL